MAVTNTSYLTNVAEFGEFIDPRAIRQLASREDADDADAALSGDRADRVTRAMNTAARRIENLWRKHYNLTDAGKITDSTSSSSPTDVVKEWNARLAKNVLETLSLTAEVTEARSDILQEIKDALAADSGEVFAADRGQQVMPKTKGGESRRGTLFDDGGYWDYVIPTSERDGFIE